ncbi:GNAT family N-acetyltransferase [Microcoleus sp. FACHB-1515]|uniref:GNAT family N-acetyltransferase n=1 Tax=Cyanophyceae TaxID=3028117 RepID=UPI0016878067|nr:GNAT family N-acetyltransferase [Microcoleus sp. FACHB-1515]MBD2093189.1 GNAT family N-acetyltransferase [Microcoleus sp. FACHB-1515]
MKSIELHTDRLWMRPYAIEDVDALHQLWCDPNVRRHLFDDKIVPREFVVEEVNDTQNDFAVHGWGQCSVFLRETNELIGFCGFRIMEGSPAPQLIYGVAPSCWGQGLATEMTLRMIEFGFEDCGFKQILGSTDFANAASRRVLEKAGMRFQQRVHQDGLDLVYFAIAL